MGLIYHYLYAGSALATRLAGIQNPQTLVLFGAGAQIAQHALLFLSLYPSLTHCTIINRTLNPRVQELAEMLHIRFPLVNVAAGALGDSEGVRGALGGADIVCCATSSTEALFEESWLNKEAHLNLVRCTSLSSSPTSLCLYL